MRFIGTLHPTDGAPVAPDTVFTFALAAGVAQTQDWLSSGSTVVANAALAGAGLVRLTGVSSSGTPLLFTANLSCTAAAAPSSGLSSGGSTNANVTITGPTMYQVPGGSTGLSVCAASSGYVMVEQWEK